jgi:glycosyltransferase involved in cell wall biosynthesis
MGEIMKILHLTYDYPDIINPDKTSAIKNIIDITDEKNDACCISLNRTAAFGKKLLYRAGSVTSLTTFGLPMGIFFIVTLLNSIRRVKASRLDFTAFDGIHAHKLTFEGPIAYGLYRTYKIPYFVTIQQTDFRVISHKPLMKHFYFNILMNAKNIVLISPWMKTKLDRIFGAARMKLLEHKTRSIPLIIDRECIASEHENGRIFCAFHMRNNYIRIKNIYRVLKAICKLKGEGTLIRLDIAGEGPASFKVRQMIDRLGIGDQVKMLGQIENGRIVNVMSEYRAFVLCSYPETFGMVYIEALCAGIPVIYSKEAGIDGFFDGLGIGIAVRHDSIREICTALKNINNTPLTFRENVRKLQESGRLSQFSKEAVKQQYDLIYR